MTVSGHRNEASIKLYSRDTSSAQKRKISETLSRLVPQAQEIVSTVENSTSTITHESEERVVVEENADNVMFDDIENIHELLYLTASQSEMVLQGITNPDEDKNQKTVVHEQVNKYNEVRCTSSKQNGPPSFVFHGCTVNLYYNQ